jgi:hypothetical protein
VTGISIERPGEAEHGCEAEPNWSRNPLVIKRGKEDSEVLLLWKYEVLSDVLRESWLMLTDSSRLFRKIG